MCPAVTRHRQYNIQRTRKPLLSAGTGLKTSKQFVKILHWIRLRLKCRFFGNTVSVSLRMEFFLYERGSDEAHASTPRCFHKAIIHDGFDS